MILNELNDYNNVNESYQRLFKSINQREIRCIEFNDLHSVIIVNGTLLSY